MRASRPSFTAAVVALGRAVYATAPRDIDVARDDVARQLLPWPLSWLERLVRALGGANAPVRALLHIASLGLVDHVELRTLAIDAALQAWIASHRNAQLVILGAGLDARAWRMTSLEHTTVFEVDHPATQAYKREQIASRPPTARDVRFVAVDFARDFLDTALAHPGHDVAQPTFWIWEGVTMYLPRAAVEDTLARIDQRSAPGSAIALTYVPTGAMDTMPVLRVLSRIAFGILGEPLVGVIPTDDLAGCLRAAHFEPTSDESADEWGRRFWNREHRPFLGPFERLVLAQRV